MHYDEGFEETYVIDFTSDKISDYKIMTKITKGAKDRERKMMKQRKAMRTFIVTELLMHQFYKY